MRFGHLAIFLLSTEYVTMSFSTKMEIFPGNEIENRLYLRLKEGSPLNLTCKIDSDKDYNIEWLILSHSDGKISSIKKSKGKNSLTISFDKLKFHDRGDLRCSATPKQYEDDIPISKTISLSIQMEKGSCIPGKFQCKSSLECLAPHYECDGVKDCSDGSDENPFNCGDVPCLRKLLCESGRCIDESCCQGETSYSDRNCSFNHFPHPCCLSFYQDKQVQRSFHISFTSTIYTIVGCILAFILFLIILVTMICRFHSKDRNPLSSHSRHSRTNENPGVLFSSCHSNYDSRIDNTIFEIQMTHRTNSTFSDLPPPYSEVPFESPPPYSVEAPLEHSGFLDRESNTNNNNNGNRNGNSRLLLHSHIEDSSSEDSN